MECVHCLDITRFYEEPWVRLAGFPNTLNRPPLVGAGGFDTICMTVCNRGEGYTACMLCCLKPGRRLHFTHFPVMFRQVSVAN